MDDEIGSIEVGKRADLVLLEADPLDDIRNTRRIAAVVVGGLLVDADTRRRLSVRSLWVQALWVQSLSVQSLSVLVIGGSEYPSDRGLKPGAVLLRLRR